MSLGTDARAVQTELRRLRKEAWIRFFANPVLWLVVVLLLLVVVDIH